MAAAAAAAAAGGRGEILGYIVSWSFLHDPATSRGEGDMSGLHGGVFVGMNGVFFYEFVYYYLPAEAGTTEVTTCVTTYTLRCQHTHNPQYVDIPNRYENN